MRRFGAVFLVTAVAATVIGLTAAAEDGGIAGKRYVLTRVNGEAVPDGRGVFVEIGDDFRLSGRICNAFHGPAAYRNGILKAENLVSTRMLCPAGNLSKLENELFQALRGGVSVLPLHDGMEWRRDASIWVFAHAGEDKPSPEAVSAPVASGGVEAGQLTGRKFMLQQVDGENFAVNMGQQPFIEFSTPEEGLRVNGSACNNFMGKAELSNGTLTMANAAATMMMCVDPKLSTFERDFQKLLREGVTLELDGKVLTLRGGDRVFTYREE